MAVDVEGALRSWANANPTLSGAGKPLAKGVLLDRPRSPGRGCYALVAIDTDVDGLDAEGITSGASVIFTVYSVTDREASRLAAVALVAQLLTLSTTRPVVGATQLIMAAPVSWPEFLDDDADEHRHQVRATVYAGPA